MKTRRNPPLQQLIMNAPSFIPFLSSSLPKLTAVVPLSHQPHHSTWSSIDIFVTHCTDTHKPISPTIDYPLQVPPPSFFSTPVPRLPHPAFPFQPSLVAYHLYAHPTRYERQKVCHTSSHENPLKTHLSRKLAIILPPFLSNSFHSHHTFQGHHFSLTSSSSTSSSSSQLPLCVARITPNSCHAKEGGGGGVQKAHLSCD